MKIKMYKFYVITSFLMMGFLMQSCGGDSSDNSESNDTEETSKESKYNGEYCASIEYYNPNSGTNTTHDYNVEVEDDYLTKINWPNGGWLDGSHFEPALIENDECSFTTDAGYKYTVTIQGAPCTFTEMSITYAQCFASLQMTPDEINENLKLMNVSLDAPCSDGMCKIIKDHVIKMRERKGKSSAMHKEVNNGYILSVYYMTSHNNVICHLVLVKKRGKFYLLEVNSSEKCRTGTMQFDTSTTDWQTTSVKEGPNEQQLYGYQMRIVDSGSDQATFENAMSNYCR